MERSSWSEIEKWIPLVSFSPNLSMTSNNDYVSGTAIDRKGIVTTFPLFCSSQDYAHSCIRIGLEFDVGTAQKYDEANDLPVAKCYKCVLKECYYDYWTGWRKTEYAGYTEIKPNDEKWEKKNKLKLKPRIDKALADLEAEFTTKLKSNDFDGGEEYAKWCGCRNLDYKSQPIDSGHGRNLDFDEKEARRLDVEGNIEDLPPTECYTCIYNGYKATFAKQRYECCNKNIKEYYDEKDRNDEY